jgi:hypothetical protein
MMIVKRVDQILLKRYLDRTELDNTLIKILVKKIIEELMMNKALK